MSGDTPGAEIGGTQDDPGDCFEDASVLTEDSKKNKIQPVKISHKDTTSYVDILVDSYSTQSFRIDFSEDMILKLTYESYKYAIHS